MPVSSALGVFEEAAERFDRIAIACSFQKEASVVLDLALRAAREKVHVFTLDTGVLFEETKTAWAEFEAHFDIEIEGARGEWPERLWETDPDACCHARKVIPLRDRLTDFDGWVTGVRRDQSESRRDTQPIAWDDKHGLYKIAPLVEWTDRDVWAHISDHGLPYHALHDQGYASIGCVPCTRPGEGRAGRWAGTDKIECGLHAA